MELFLVLFVLLTVWGKIFAAAVALFIVLRWMLGVASNLITVSKWYSERMQAWRKRKPKK